MAVLLMTIACRAERPKPAEIDPGDICAYCKMVISERKYAAQFVDRQGSVFKFDDIGCMLRFVKEHRLRQQIAAYYVTDYGSRTWREAEEAVYLRTALASPMRSGLVAFRNQANASAASPKYGGPLFRFDQLWQALEEREEQSGTGR